MSGINDLFGSSNNYASSLFSGTTSGGSNLGLTDYAAIRNGSYGKLVKAVYKKQNEAAKAAEDKDTKQTQTMIKAGTDSLKKSINTLMDESLWEKKTIKKEDGSSEEGYDWDAITKAVKGFVDDYNNVLGKTVDSNSTGILRNAARMTSTSAEMSKLLGDIGIKIGSDNKLEVDEEKLKKGSIGTMKTLFTGMHSFADKMLQKANAIARATAGSNNTYTPNATYSDTLSALASGLVDKEI